MDFDRLIATPMMPRGKAGAAGTAWFDAIALGGTVTSDVAQAIRESW